MTPELIAAKLALRLAEQEAHEAADDFTAMPLHDPERELAFTLACRLFRVAADASAAYVRALSDYQDSLTNR